MTYIQGGVFLQALSSISTLLSKAFEWLTDSKDLKVTDSKKVKSKDGKSEGALFTVTSGTGRKIRVKALQSSGRSSVFDVYLLGDDGKKDSKLGIPAEDIQDFVQDFIDDKYAETYDPDDTEIGGKDFDVDKTFEDDENVKSCTLFATILKDSKTGNVEVIKASSNYDNCESFKDLDLVMCSDEFINETENGGTYTFQLVSKPNSDEIDIEFIDENKIEPCSCNDYSELISNILAFKIYLEACIHFGNEEVQDTKLIVENFYSTLINLSYFEYIDLIECYNQAINKCKEFKDLSVEEVISNMYQAIGFEYYTQSDPDVKNLIENFISYSIQLDL